MKIYLPSYFVSMLMSFFVVWSSAAAMVSLEQKLAKTKISLTSLRDKLTTLKSALQKLKKSLQPAEPLTAEEQKELEGYEQDLKSDDKLFKEIALFGFVELVNKGKILDRATVVAQEALESPVKRIRKGALAIFKSLVQQGQAFDIALAAAEKNIMQSSAGTYAASLSLDIFTESLKQGKGFGQALVAAKKLVDSTDSSDLKAGYTLLSKLIEFDNQIADDLLAHAKELLDPLSQTWSKGIKFLSFLLGRGKGISDATVLAEKCINSFDEKIWSKGVATFDLLLAHEKAVNETMAYAEKFVNSTDEKDWLKGIALFKRLFNHGKAFDKAIPIAERAKASSDEDVQGVGYELFSVVELNLAFWKNKVELAHYLEKYPKDASKAASVAGQVARSATNKNLLLVMNALFAELFKQGHGFKEAVNAAPTLLSVAPLSAMNFYKISIEHGMELDEVFVQALELMKSESTKAQGYALLRTFVEHNHLLDKVLQVVADDIKATGDPRMELMILKMLAEKNYKPGQIYDAAQNAIKLNERLLKSGPMLDVFKALQVHGFPLSDKIKDAINKAM